jgi:membrane peptidoglycan carboxypeptidase
MATAMKAVVNGGTGRPANPNDGIPLIGKTGTTDFEWHLWFAGATTALATAIWTGNVQGKVSLRYTAVNGENAGDLRFDVWKRYMRAADGKYGGTEFGRPNASLVSGTQVGVPDVTGMSADNARALLISAGFAVSDGATVDSLLPAGSIESYSPSGKAVAGSTIEIRTSNGQLRTVPEMSGMSLPQARDAIVAAGIDATQIVLDGQETGTVVGSSPAAGEPIRYGPDRLTLHLAPKTP